MKVTWGEIAGSAGPPSMEVRFTTSETGTDIKKVAITNSPPITRIINEREKGRSSVRLLQWGRATASKWGFFTR
jgi:hypothetical protein